MNERLPNMTTEPGDHELMARLAKGDDLALNALMRRWSDRIVSFLYRMTGRHDTAVDLAQETFVKLYQARERYRPSGGEFSTWLFTIASNLAKITPAGVPAILRSLLIPQIRMEIPPSLSQQTRAKRQAKLP